MNARLFCTLAIAFLAIVSPSAAQTGTITFYSIDLSLSHQIKTALAPVGTVAFTGWLFDGEKKLAHAVRGRFLTFQISAGPHNFTGVYKSKGPGNEPCHPKECLTLNIESGKHYCVRLSAKDVNTFVIPVMFVSSRVEQVSCQEAVLEAGKYKRIDVKRVDPGVLSSLDLSADFPKED